MRKTKNSTLAIVAAVPAMPPKPSTAATTAIIRNTRLHPSMFAFLLMLIVNRFSLLCVQRVNREFTCDLCRRYILKI